MSQRRQASCIVPNTTSIQKSLNLLVKLGYVNSFIVLNVQKLQVFLKYDEKGQSAVRLIRQISTPSLRVYTSYKHLLKISLLLNSNNPYSTLILSTPIGLVTHFSAINRKFGGEVLFLIN